MSRNHTSDLDSFKDKTDIIEQFFLFARKEQQKEVSKLIASEDFVYTWQRIVDPATAAEYAYLTTYAHLLNADKIISGEITDLNELGVKADGNKVIFTLTSAAPQFESLLTFLKLYDISEGEIDFQGKTISTLKSKELKEFRKDAQMIFQDPQASLNGRMKIKDIVAEGLDIHGLTSSKEEREERVQHLLDLVGLNKDHLTRYPHEFSSGQRQRIGIARALAVKPKFIIADEPISALDVSIQAQVVNLMQRLQEKQGLTYLFIAHDLSMVKYISDRIGVMH